MKHKQFSIKIFVVIINLIISSNLISQNNLQQNTNQSLTIKDQSQQFISDGSEINLPHLGFKITPPVGWEVLINHNNLSLILREPNEKSIQPHSTNETPNQFNNITNRSKIKYKPNITMATIHHPSAIDKKRAQQLIKELMNTYGKNSLIKNYNILEYKFFDFKSKKDGILVYSMFDINDIKMMQMHVLVSGSTKQYLLTYTDIAETFSTSEHFNLAWNAIISMNVIGNPPKRYQNYVYYAGIAIIGLILVFLRIMRSRKAKYDYSNEADIIYRNDEDIMNTSIFPHTQTNVWVIKSNSNHTNTTTKIQKHNKISLKKDESMYTPTDNDNTDSIFTLSFIKNF